MLTENFPMFYFYIAKLCTTSEGHCVHFSSPVSSLYSAATTALPYVPLTVVISICLTPRDLLHRWKVVGPSKSFLALVDMAAVHSSCRLCIHVATKIRVKEDAGAPKRHCKCTSKNGHTLYHLYVRERGRFYMESIFIL